MESWTFTATGDGAFTLANAASGRLLGVARRHRRPCLGARPTVTAAPAGGPAVGQQWFLIHGSSGDGGYRLVNRYSGLVLALSGTSGRRAETTPARNWTDTSGSSVGGGRTPAEQTLSLTPTGQARTS
ncbi:RICIN domain-containing protein [Streptomyces diastatochromogenes]|nr:RICIN domain-containing protein [Streptomyces diastatochromogenes]